MTLKVEQHPETLWHGMTREDTARHEKTREGTARHEKTREGMGTRARGTGHEGTECFLLKVDRPMRTKQAKEIANMIADIYKVGPLTYPKVFQCDNGSEFKAEVTKVVEKAWSKDTAHDEKV